jgi:hypothetical protein
MIVVKCSDYKGRRKSNYKNVPYDSGDSHGLPHDNGDNHRPPHGRGDTDSYRLLRLPHDSGDRDISYEGIWVEIRN